VCDHVACNSSTTTPLITISTQITTTNITKLPGTTSITDFPSTSTKTSSNITTTPSTAPYPTTFPSATPSTYPTSNPATTTLPIPITTSSPCPPVSGWTPRYGSCYQTSPTRLTWFEARHFCTKQGGYLAEIQSLEEQKRVEQLLHLRTSYWIGLADFPTKGHYTWQHSMGSLTWNYFWPGQPDNWNGEEDCVEMHHDKNANTDYRWGWNDVSCYADTYTQLERPIYALCEANFKR